MFPGSAIRVASMLSGPFTAGIMMVFNLLRVGRSTRAILTLTLTAGLAVTLPLAAWSGWLLWGDFILPNIWGSEIMGLVWGAWMLLFIYLLVAHGIWVFWKANGSQSIKRHLAFGGLRVHTVWSALLILGGAGLWWSYVVLALKYLGAG